MDNKIKRSEVEILKYLEDANIGQSLSKEALESAVKKLAEISSRFNPEDMKDFQELITQIAGSLSIRSIDAQDMLIKYVTGYSVKEIQEYGKSKEEGTATPEPEDLSEPEVLDGDVIELPEENKINILQGVKNLYNRAADASMVNMTMTNFYRAVNVYEMVRGTNTLGNIVKGTLVGATALTVNTVGVAAITTLRLARFGAKTLSAVKGTLAKAMHNKALRDISKVEKGLAVQKNDLQNDLRKQEAGVDKKAAELGYIGENGKVTNPVYKKIVESRKNGEISTEECENALSERYDEASQKRDMDLIRVSNGIGIHVLQKHFGITEADAMQVIENLTCTPDGKIECENFDFSNLTEKQVNVLRNSAKRHIKIGQISENAKIEAMKYVQIIDGIITVKEGENIEKLPRDVKMMVSYLRNRKATKEDINRINAENSEIAFLAMCEQELLGRVAVKANQDMTQEFAQKKAKVKSEQRGFFKSTGEMIEGLNLRARAKAIVEQRKDQFINDSIRRNEGASERLATLARERLQTRENGEVDKNEHTKNEHSKDEHVI